MEIAVWYGCGQVDLFGTAKIQFIGETEVFLARHWARLAGKSSNLRSSPDFLCRSECDLKNHFQVFFYFFVVEPSPAFLVFPIPSKLTFTKATGSPLSKKLAWLADCSSSEVFVPVT